MDITLKIGTRSETVQVPEANLQGILTPNEVSVALTGEAEVRRALNEPIGTPRLRDIVHPGEKIAIITSDITRPMPTWKVMPALLDELYDAGVKREDITLVFALGSHRCHTEEEQRHLAGDRAWSEITCVDGNTADCVHIGVTSRGTPVRVSPALSPVRPGTSSAVPVYTASKRPKGVLPLGPRRRVTDRPCQSSSTLPSMAAPLQGW